MGPCPGAPTEEDLTRAALRISVSAWSELERDSGMDDDVELLRKYILLCPYLSPDSPAIAAALSGLQGGTSKALTKRTMEESQNTKAASSKVPTKKRATLGSLARTLFLDSPLMIIFGVYLSLVWIHHVHDHYLQPQLEVAVWSDERAVKEMTYYNRFCDVNDLSTTDGRDLFLPNEATPEDAYQHQLRHGFTVFPGVLRDETATNLRNYIDSRNSKLTDEESIYVIKSKNRFSFALGTEEPSVAKAMMELTTNERLTNSMEKILGKNPALIEMTAITSSYGAVDQTWHDDIVPEASPVQYARAFGPSYSIFVQLQNTTKRMGATDACPGTHMCPNGKLTKVCQEHGFPMVDEEGYWRAGDALLMNMNSWHRGAAHTDPDALDRVMLILTFVPQPQSRAESRQMSQGITFSLRWDMWGHTWSDLANAASSMRQPWAVLRALGLYKSPSADWGVDFVSSATMRMANEDNGFRKDELNEFVERGGFKFLPKFLQGDSEEDESWHDFLLNTLLRCESFMNKARAYAAGAYMLLSLVMGLAYGHPVRRVGKALFRIALIHEVVFVLYMAALKHVDSSQWAHDIQNNLRYTSPFGTEENTYTGASTMPHRNDVLVETRYNSKYLNMYNDYIGNHPGNRLWNKLVNEKASIYSSYSGLPPVFRRAVVDYIVGAVHNSPGRFLYQNPRSDWVEMDNNDAVKHTTRQLAVKSNSIRKKVVKELDFLIADAKYGPLRESVMNQNDIFPFLTKLRSRLIDDIPPPEKPVSAGEKSTSQTQLLNRTFSLKKPVSKLKPRGARPVVLHVGQLPEEPEVGAWLRAGDIIDAAFEDDGNTYWHKAELLHVSSSNSYSVVYLDDGKFDQVERDSVRRYFPPEIGDTVDVMLGDEFTEGEIVNDWGDGYFDVEVDGEVHEEVDGDKIRRM